MTTDETERSQKMIVSNNIIIQNSNLQNCNVFINDPKAARRIKTTKNARNVLEININGLNVTKEESSQNGESLSPVIKKSKQSLADFTITQIVGEGHQGKVVRAVCKKTNKEYALKIIPSKQLKESKQIQHIFNEKKILHSLRDQPRYFPTLQSTFSDVISFQA